MKCNVYIGNTDDERVDVYSNERTELIDQIETLVKNSELSIIGFSDGETVPLNIAEIQRFFVEDGKVFASVQNKKYAVRYRIYQLEERLGNNFVKINQSSIANVCQIKKFVAGWDGSLIVEMKNGERDFVSRRQTKIVMRRFNLK